MTTNTAEVVREYGPFPGADKVGGVTYDGQHVWFAGGDALYAFDPVSGNMVRSIDVAAHAGTAFDGRYLFQLAADRIQKIDPESGQVLSTIPSPGKGDSGLTWAEGTLWVGQHRDRKILQIDPETGAILRTIESNRFVTGVTWVDGVVARHVGRRGERRTSCRSCDRRGAGAAGDAARGVRVGTRVGRSRSVLLRRRRQRKDPRHPPPANGAARRIDDRVIMKCHRRGIQRSEVAGRAALPVHISPILRCVPMHGAHASFRGHVAHYDGGFDEHVFPPAGARRRDWILGDR